MPQVAVALLKVGFFVFEAFAGAAAAATLGAGAAVAIGAAVVVGGTLVAKRMMSLFEVEIPTVDSDASRQRTVRSTIEPQKIIYGEALVSGPISFIGLSGTDNSDLYQTIVLAGHEVTDITNIHMDDVVITDAQINGGSTAGGNVTGGTFGPKGSPSTTICVINKYRGLASQTADSLLTNAFTNYTSAHRGDGIAYLSMKWVLNDDSAETWDKFAPSNVKALVKGKPVYDPRLDTGAPNYNPLNQLFITYNATSGSYVGQGQNPALVLADYLISDLGMGISPSKIDWSSFITAANGCDVSVNVPNNGTEKRFTCNGVLFTTDSHQKNINKILSSMNGNLVYSNGKYIVHAGIYEDETPENPFGTLNENDLIGAISVTTSLERSDRFNTIKGLFIDPSQNHKSSEFPKVQLADAVARDNDEILEKEVQYPMTNSSYMAQRLSFKLIKLSDQQKIISFPANLSALRITAGDRVKVSIEELSWSDKIFQCVGWNFSEEGGVNLTLREDSESAYDDPVPNANPALSEYSTITATGDITDAFRGVPSPSGLRAASGEKKVFLNWVNPGKPSDFGTIEIYASASNNIANAVKIGETDGTQFVHDGNNAADQITVDDTRYYWIRSKKNVGTVAENAVSVYQPDSTTGVGPVTVLATLVDWGNVADPTIGIDINSDTISINTGSATTTTGQTVATSGIEAGTTVTQGGITMNQGGSIKGGQSAYNSGTGFFLGYDTNAYKFSIGNASNEALTFDGTNLAVTGAITATSGTFTGTVNASAGVFTGDVSTDAKFIAGSNSSTVTLDGTTGANYSIFAGADNGLDASFKVASDGVVEATRFIIRDDANGQVLIDTSNTANPFSGVVYTSISQGSGAGVDTVAGTLADNAGEITITTTQAETFLITAKVAIDDNDGSTNNISGASTTSTTDAENQLKGADLKIEYYLKEGAGAYALEDTEIVTFTEGTPSSSQIKVFGVDRGAGYSGSLTRYFAVIQGGGAAEFVTYFSTSSNANRARTYAVTTASISISGAGTHKIKILARLVDAGTNTTLTNSTTPALVNNNATGTYGGSGIVLDAAQSPPNQSSLDNFKRIYEATSANGFVASAANTFAIGEGTTILTSGGTISGDLVITGDLTVQGTTTTINVADLTVADKDITLNYSTGDSSSTANNAGIIIQDAVNSTTDASILWKTASDTFEFSHGASINGRLTTDSVTIDDDGSGSPLLRIQADDSSPWAIQFENSAISSPNTGNLRGYLNHGNGFFYWMHEKDFGDDSYPYTIFQFRNGSTTQVGLSLTGTAASFGGSIVASGNVSISKTVPILIINDTDATTPTNQVGYISFQRQGTEKAWIGYGGTTDDTFKIRNTEGPITISGPTNSLNLDVLGNVRLGQSTVNTFMYINGGETSTGEQDREAGIIWQKGGSQKWETYVEAGSNHYYKFYSYTDSQEVLQLRNNGDVQAPNGQFIAENFMFEGVSGKIRFGGTGDDGDYLLLADVSSGSNSFALVQDSATKISVDGVTGNFGVLTATPKATIDVAQAGNQWEDGILIRHYTGDTGWNIHAEDNTANELWFGYNADTSLALTSQAATTLMALNSTGHVKITGATDYQLLLSGGASTWSGINFSDTDANDNFWYRGSTSTFAIGGGGSTAVGKKLHVDGRTSIGSTFDNLTTASQLYVYESADSPSGTSGTLSSVISVAARTDAVGDGAAVDFVSVWGGSDVYQHTAVNAGWVTARVGGIYDNGAGNGGALVFYTNSGTSATSGSTYANLTEKMRIKPNGEIHVGGTKVIDQSRNATFTSLTTPVLDGTLVYLTNSVTPTGARFQLDVEGVASQQALYTYWYDGTSYNQRTAIGGNDGNYFNVLGQFQVGGVKTIDSVGNFFGKTQTLVGASGTSVIESIRNPSTSWSQYALTRYGTEGADVRYMDFGYFRGATEATRGLVIKSQADATLFTFLDNGNFEVGTSTAIGSDRRGYFSSLTSISGASNAILVLNDTGATSAATSSTYLSFQHNGTEFSWLGHWDSGSNNNSWLYLSAPDRVYFYNGAYYHYRKNYSASNRGLIINNIGSAEAEYNGVNYDSVVIAQSDVPTIRLRETLNAQELTFTTGNEYSNASTIGATGRLVFATNRTAGEFGYRNTGAAMVIDTVGNVGIGLGLSGSSALNPSFTLDVERDTDTWVSRIYNTGSDADAQGLLVRSDATSAHAATVFGVYASSVYRMVVKSSGVTEFNGGAVTVNADNTINWGSNRGRLTWDSSYAYVRGLADHGLKLGGDNSTAITIDGVSGTTATFANTTYWSSVGIVSWGSGGFVLGNSYGMRAESGYALSLGSNGVWDRFNIDTSGNVYENSNRLRGYRTGTLTAAANVNYPVGWYRVAATPIQANGYGARSAFKVRIYTGGGYFAPGTLEAKCFKDWSAMLRISSVETSGTQYFTKVRLVADANYTYFEVYIGSAINNAGSSSFQVEASVEGLNSGPVLPYTETLVAGLSSPTYSYEMETRGYNPSLAVANLLVRDDLYLPSGGIIYFNGQTSAGNGNYNINGNSGFFDTLNSGYDSDPLELCYVRGSRVTIGTGTYGSKDIRAKEGVFTSANDYQLHLRGKDTWAGIKFSDNVDSTTRDEHLWYNGENKTFALGGGGSNVANKKLHVDGGMTVGSGYDTTSVVANQIRSQGGLQSDNAIQINYTGNGNNGSDACLHILHNSADWKIKTEGKVGSTYYDYGYRNSGAGSYAYYQLNGGAVSARFDYAGNAIFAGNVTAYGSPSDIRLKENIDVIENALDKVTKLRGVTFNYKKDGSRSTGLIAQELLEVLPEAVYEPEELNPDDEKFYAVRYGNTVGLLVEAIKELKAENDELKAMMQKILDKEK